MANGPTGILSDIQNKMLRLGPSVKQEGLALFNEIGEDLHELRGAVEKQGREIKTALLNKITEFLEG